MSCDGFQDVLLGRFLNFAAEEKLVEHEVGLLEVEDDVKLANLSTMESGIQFQSLTR